MIKLSESNKAMLASYARHILGAGVAVYVSTGDLKMAVNALWAAVLPVIIRYLDPNDTAFGRNK